MRGGAGRPLLAAAVRCGPDHRGQSDRFERHAHDCDRRAADELRFWGGVCAGASGSCLRRDLDAERNWGNIVTLIGRMKPGVTLAQAQADTERVVSDLYLNMKYAVVGSLCQGEMAFRSSAR